MFVQYWATSQVFLVWSPFGSNKHKKYLWYQRQVSHGFLWISLWDVLRLIQGSCALGREKSSSSQSNPILRLCATRQPGNAFYAAGDFTWRLQLDYDQTLHRVKGLSWPSRLSSSLRFLEWVFAKRKIDLCWFILRSAEIARAVHCMSQHKHHFRPLQRALSTNTDSLAVETTQSHLLSFRPN